MHGNRDPYEEQEESYVADKTAIIENWAFWGMQQLHKLEKLSPSRSAGSKAP